MGASDDSGKRPVYVVLGATGGVGSDLCRTLARSGGRVVVVGRSSASVARLATEIDGRPVVADCARFSEVDEILRSAAADGRLVGTACCAGSLLLKPAHLTSEQELQETLSANLATAFAAVRATARAVQGAASVVLVSSAAAHIGLPNHEAIAAAKGAVAALVRSAAASYAHRGIRVNGVAPGLVETPLTERITGNPKSLAASESLHALGRIGKPDEVAGLIAWLLGPEATWVTGQIWGMDGGLATLKASARR